MLVDLRFLSNRTIGSLDFKLSGRAISTKATEDYGQSVTKKASCRGTRKGKDTPWKFLTGWRRISKGIYFGAPTIDKYLCLFSQCEEDPKWTPKFVSPMGFAETTKEVLDYLKPYIEELDQKYILVISPLRLTSVTTPVIHSQYGRWVGQRKLVSNDLAKCPDLRKVVSFRLIPLLVTQRNSVSTNAEPQKRSGITVV